MALKSDDQGFLLAEPMDARELARGIDGVRSDTSAILQLLKGGMRARVARDSRARASDDAAPAARAPRQRSSSPGSSASGGTPAAARARDAQGRFASSRSAAPELARAVNSMTRQQAQERAMERREARSAKNVGEDAGDGPRDARGRFTGKGGTGGGSGGDGGERDKAEGFMGRMFDKVKGMFSGLGSGNADMDKIDPAVEAAHELKNLTSGPLKVVGKAAGSIIGRVKSSFGGDDQPSLLKRIIAQLRGLRKDESDFSRAELRALDQHGGGDSGGGGGLLGMIGGGLMAALGALLSPIGIALAAAGTLAWGLFTDSGKQFFSWLGDKLSAAWDGLIGYIQPLWDGLVSGVQKTWDGMVSYLQSGWDTLTKKLGDIGKSITDTFDSVIAGIKGFLKDKLGVDVDAVTAKVKEVAAPVVDKAKEVGGAVVDGAKAVGGAAWDKAKELGGGAWDKTKELGGAAWDKTKEVGSAAWDKTKQAGGAAKDWILGKTSQMFESGKGGAGTVSSGKGDAGGASYGTYQLASKTGTLDQFLKSSGYGEQFAGLKPGTPEFDAKWKQVAASDPSFGTAQHDFIKQTHFDPQMEKLQKSGIDLSGHGAAVQDAVWSTSVQFGGKTGLIQSALKGKDTSKMSDADIVSAIQDYKLQNNDSLFKSSSDKVRAGTAARAQKEKDALLGLAGSGTDTALASAGGAIAPAAAAPAAAPLASLNIAAPRVPSAPAPAPTPSADIPVQMNSDGPTKVVVANQKQVGQDLGQRRLAQIATGGLA